MPDPVNPLSPGTLTPPEGVSVPPDAVSTNPLSPGDLPRPPPSLDDLARSTTTEFDVPPVEPFVPTPFVADPHDVWDRFDLDYWMESLNYDVENANQCAEIARTTVNRATAARDDAFSAWDKTHKTAQWLDGELARTQSPDAANAARRAHEAEDTALRARDAAHDAAEQAADAAGQSVRYANEAEAARKATLARAADADSAYEEAQRAEEAHAPESVQIPLRVAANAKIWAAETEKDRTINAAANAVATMALVARAGQRAAVECAIAIGAQHTADAASYQWQISQPR